MFEDVAKFHVQILGLVKPGEPVPLSPEMVQERFLFMREELNEFLEASHAKDEVGAIDGLLDLVYVALGTLWLMGVDADRCWSYVQEANMAKQRGIGPRGNKIDAIKPEGWQKPDVKIEAYLAEARAAK